MPLLNLFWTMLMFFLFFAWIWVLITVFIDIFRSHDLNGWLKALWVVFVIVLPLLGVLVYLISRGDKMHERQVDQAIKQQKQMDDYVRKTAGASGASSADELAKLSELNKSGVLTDEEFAAQKAKLLS